MSILSVNTIIPFSNSNIEIESGSIQGNVIGTTTTASYVQLQNVDGHTEFSQSVATALENTDSFPYTGSAAISGSLTFSSDSNFIPPKGTENQKPSNPEAGTFYYNTDNGNVEVYTGNIWAILSFENVVRAGTAVGSTEVFDGNISIPISATGGTVSNITVNDIDYKVHTFTNTSTFNVTAGSDDVDYLIVAAGGGGGGLIAAGGGAGGMLTGTTFIESGSYDVTIGSGGTGGVGWNNYPQQGTSGGNSSFNNIIAIGGGGAAAYGGEDNRINGLDGGSGGGGSADNAGNAGSGTPGQGNDGGLGRTNNNNGGGGGGAGAAGQNASDGSYAGDGGDGLTSDINGTSTYYAGGGGGGSRTGNGSAGAGGQGGGGNGTTSTVRAQDGTANTGGGGGGAGYDTSTTSQMGGNGGSGIVIIRYQV